MTDYFDQFGNNSDDWDDDPDDLIDYDPEIDLDRFLGTDPEDDEEPEPEYGDFWCDLDPEDG